MTYSNAARVIPKELLDEIQRYFPQGYLYIPPKADRKPWGSVNGVREQIYERNQAICREYLAGVKVKVLAEKYHLAENSIYHIIRNQKKDFTKAAF